MPVPATGEPRRTPNMSWGVYDTPPTGSGQGPQLSTPVDTPEGPENPRHGLVSGARRRNCPRVVHVLSTPPQGAEAAGQRVSRPSARASPLTGPGGWPLGAWCGVSCVRRAAWRAACARRSEAQTGGDIGDSAAPVGALQRHGGAGADGQEDVIETEQSGGLGAGADEGSGPGVGPGARGAQS
jgi:hypothetical protein